MSKVRRVQDEGLQLELPDTGSPAPLRFESSGERVAREGTRRDGTTVVTVEVAEREVLDAGRTDAERFNSAWLRRTSPPRTAGPEMAVADLFCGLGGLGIGAHEAARAFGFRAETKFAVESDAVAAKVFADNFKTADLRISPIEELLDGEPGEPLSFKERRLGQELAGLDLVMGGPPCQGNSDLNNHTRRVDPRNRLYLYMVRFVEVVRPRFVLIENVPGVAHSRDGVVRISATALEAAGYAVDAGLANSADFGAPQSRRRHLLLAARRDSGIQPSLKRMHADFGRPSTNVLSAIGDLAEEPERGVFGTSAQHKPINQERIRFLFENELYDLPDSERPDCHRLKQHSYRSVYGRMRPDEPAPTITAGFGSCGQGRFVHPTQPRTLTPHEAARVQGIPDFFSFRGASKRGDLQQLIGNAVPSHLAFAAVGELVR